MAQCADYDFKLVTRQEFMDATDRPDGLLERARGVHPDHSNKKDLTTFTHVVYDPLADYEGWMLWGNDPEALDAETMEMVRG